VFRGVDEWADADEKVVDESVPDADDDGSRLWGGCLDVLSQETRGPFIDRSE
jgi:hypothetical protein